MRAESFTLPSFAKINWLLRVLGKRADGFHELCTIFQTVSLADFLTFSEDERVVLTCDEKSVPTDERNLIFQAATILREKYKVEKGVKIHLEKNIPSPGGLGGGSSNAAVALLGLAKLWEIEIDYPALVETGKRIGSDVPFFFCGGTAYGVGRGTEIRPLKDLEEKFLLIVAPRVSVSTRAAFERLNAPDLTNKASKSILQICRDVAYSLDLRQSQLANDFEKTVFETEPEIRLVKEKLLSAGSRRALLSGSGASVFAIFDSEKEMRKAFRQIESETDWRVFPVETVSRSQYRTALAGCGDLLLKDF